MDEVSLSLTRIFEAINKEAKKTGDFKTATSNILGLAAFTAIPLISISSGLGVLMIGNLPDGKILSRADLVISMSNGIIDKKLTTNKKYIDAFTSLDKTMTNPLTNRSQSAATMRQILTMHYEVYKPFVR